MSPFLAYILGLFTILLILIPFWTAAILNGDVAEAYKNTVCYKVCEITT